MCCLDIVWVIVSPRPAHSFRILVVWDYVVVVGECFMADRAYPTLLPHFEVHQFPHFCWRSEFSISTRMVRIFDPLNSKSDQLWLRQKFPATAGKRSVNRAELVRTESHDTSPVVPRGMYERFRRAAVAYASGSHTNSWAVFLR
jgi:hypothetical protein